MQYHGPTGQLTIKKENLENATHLFYVLIAKIRKQHNLPLHPYGHPTWDEALSQMNLVVGIAKSCGIDLGGEQGNEIDVSKFV